MDMESIYREYHDKLLSYIRYKVNNEEDAEDICSEVFIKVQKNLDKYEEQKASVARWIYVIAGNTIIDYYRARKVSEEIPEDLPSESDLEDSMLNRITLQNLADAMKELSEEEKLIIVLHYYEDMSLKDIERKTGLSYGQVKIRHNNALKVLRKLL
ncbi:MAG: sigma-70 family RNA polymerase sigma factor [Lachnospiraceae bacterium]|nr:sigma-70 family RNA polymerase sigma factor [Lachnospiraceae bacterium]